MGTFTIESRLLVDYKGGVIDHFQLRYKLTSTRKICPEMRRTFFGTDDDIAPIKKDTNGHSDSDSDSDSDSETQKNENLVA